MRTLRFLAFAALIVAPAPGSAQQGGKPTVAVLPFNYTSLVPGVEGKSLGDAISDMVLTEFAKSSKIKMVDRGMVDDLLMKQQLLVSGRVSDEAALRAGKLLGAQYIVTGQVTIAGNDVRMDIRIVDPETSSFPMPPFKERGKKDDLLDLVEKMVEGFTKDLKLPNRADVIAAELIPVGASLAFSRGLDFEKRGKKDLAKKHFQKALELSPSHADAKAGLDRVR